MSTVQHGGQVAGKKLGILLSTPDFHPSVDTVVGLCNAALQQGSDVYLYLIDEGVKNIRDPRLVTLAETGMKLFVAPMGANNMGCQLKTSTLGSASAAWLSFSIWSMAAIVFSHLTDAVSLGGHVPKYRGCDFRRTH